jgi:hypothetical protein
MKYLGGLLGFVACLSCSGGGNGLSSPSSAQGDFPSVDTGETNALCTTRGPTTYMIPGLSDHVTDPNAASLEARMRVGEELAIQVEGFGCGSWATRQWESTNPAAAARPSTRYSAGPPSQRSRPARPECSPLSWPAMARLTGLPLPTVRPPQDA